MNREEIAIEAVKNLDQFNKAMDYIKKMADLYGKTFEEVMEDIGPIEAGTLTYTQFIEILEK